MIKSNPYDLAVDLLKRSNCAVQVAAVIWDGFGIFGWGWNHAGNGFGQHAEIHAIGRTNIRRLKGASIAVAGRRKRNGRVVVSLPCADCFKRISKHQFKEIWIESKSNGWQRIQL